MKTELIFIVQSLVVAYSALFALRAGSYALVTFISITMVLANICVNKIISLGGYTATGADSFIIGGICAGHLLQEYYGQESAKRALYISFYMMIFVLTCTQLQIYLPAHPLDQAHIHMSALFQSIPRITAASLISYLIVQRFDITLYAYIKRTYLLWPLAIRNFLCAAISQALDTILFSILGLYGNVPYIMHIIFVSYILKLLGLMICSPAVMVSRYFVSTTRH